jgi:flagellar protein FliO/FliZ
MAFQAASEVASNVLVYGNISPVRVIAALTLCLLIGVAAIVLMRRSGLYASIPRIRTNKHMRVLETVRLDPKNTLHLLRIGDEDIVVACGPGGVAKLHHGPSRPESTL